MRVEIPHYTCRWMFGDRYGEVVGRDETATGRSVLRVRMDISGKTVRVIATDCTVLD